MVFIINKIKEPVDLKTKNFVFGILRKLALIVLEKKIVPEKWHLRLISVIRCGLVINLLLRVMENCPNFIFTILTFVGAFLCLYDDMVVIGSGFFGNDILESKKLRLIFCIGGIPQEKER